MEPKQLMKNYHISTKVMTKNIKMKMKTPWKK